MTVLLKFGAFGLFFCTCLGGNIPVALASTTEPPARKHVRPLETRPHVPAIITIEALPGFIKPDLGLTDRLMICASDA